jgi:hypothetical protein
LPNERRTLSAIHPTEAYRFGYENSIKLRNVKSAILNFPLSPLLLSSFHFSFLINLASDARDRRYSLSLSLSLSLISRDLINAQVNNKDRFSREIQSKN